MKFMLLIYDNPDTREVFFAPGNEGLMTEMEELMKELTASGELIGGEALADPSKTQVVRVVDGVPAVTDGPLAEAKEHFGGYLLVDVASAARAAEIASRWPSSRFTPMEVRPLMEQSGPQE